MFSTEKGIQSYIIYTLLPFLPTVNQHNTFNGRIKSYTCSHKKHVLTQAQIMKLFTNPKISIGMKHNHLSIYMLSALPSLTQTEQMLFSMIVCVCVYVGFTHKGSPVAHPPLPWPALSSGSPGWHSPYRWTASHRPLPAFSRQPPLVASPAGESSQPSPGNSYPCPPAGGTVTPKMDRRTGGWGGMIQMGQRRGKKEKEIGTNEDCLNVAVSLI